MQNLVKNLKTLEKLERYFANRNIILDGRKEIMDALFLLLEPKYNLEIKGDLYDLDLDYQELLDLLLNFDFNILNQKIETERNILSEDIVGITKAKIKHKGLIWLIYKYDADPFPSNPHAHELDNNIKLHLGNGKCYRKRRHIESISKKNLIKIREKAKVVFKSPLPILEI